jgi:Recombination endonuclease VII
MEEAPRISTYQPSAEKKAEWAKRQKLRRQADPTKQRAAVNKWYARNREYVRKKAIHRQYGLTPEAFDVLLQVQSGGCGICKTPLRCDRGTHVDHDHASGRVRGLLCHSCNLALGLLADSPNRLLAAADYLKGRAR